MNLIEKKIVSFSSCHRGASHKKQKKVCQDAAFACYKNKGAYAMAIVSDGHGSNDYFRSDKGAKQAVIATKKSISRFMSMMKSVDFHSLNPDGYMRQLEMNIVYNWRQAILKDYQKHPFTEKEKALMSEKGRKRYESNPDSYFVKAYGTTLIAVVVYPEHFWFGLHIGDGKCVAQYSDGHFDQPIAWDERCFLNVTTSLCDERPLENFRHCFHIDNFPTALFVGSDGVDDCFANDEDLYGFYHEVIQTFQEKSFQDAYKEVDSFLPVMSENGSGDDISVSGIIMLG